jgi:DNA-binding NtrC family response regulator
MKNLNRLYWLKQEIMQIENQIKELTVLSATAMSGMPSSKKASSPVERFVLRMESLTEKLAQKYEELSAETERIEEYIEGIEDVEVRLIARKRFIEHKEYQTIGDEMFIDRTTAYRKLKRYVEGDRHGKT